MQRDCGEVQVRFVGGMEREQGGWREQATGTSRPAGLPGLAVGWGSSTELCVLARGSTDARFPIADLAGPGPPCTVFMGSAEARAFTSTHLECQRSLIPSSPEIGEVFPHPLLWFRVTT